MAKNYPDLKTQFLLNPEVIFLNHGSFGATPRPVFETYQRWQREVEAQPVEFIGRRATTLLHESRSILAKFLQVDVKDLAFITNATTGINIIARSLNLDEEDEVLATDHEYGAVDRTWTFLSNKHGFRYFNQPIGLPVSSYESLVEDLWKGVTVKTRVICISQITSPTALTIPIADICRKARESGILTVIDGAHAPGQINLSLVELGADFYTGNLHKWLCAPKGAAFLYARPEVQHLIEPLIVSWGWQNQNPGPTAFSDCLENNGTRDISAFLAVPEAINFQELNNWTEVRKQCRQLASEAAQRIQSLTNMLPFTPDFPDWYTQMVSIPLPDHIDPAQIQQILRQNYRIEIPVFTWKGKHLLRLSVQGYNSEEDIDALISALSSLIK